MRYSKNLREDFRTLHIMETLGKKHGFLVTGKETEAERRFNMEYQDFIGILKKRIRNTLWKKATEEYKWKSFRGKDGEWKRYCRQEFPGIWSAEDTAEAVREERGGVTVVTHEEEDYVEKWYTEKVCVFPIPKEGKTVMYIIEYCSFI